MCRVQFEIMVERYAKTDIESFKVYRRILFVVYLFNLTLRSYNFFGAVAHMVERSIRIRQAGGSIPPSSNSFFCIGDVYRE